jgi:hypothetical protein
MDRTEKKRRVKEWARTERMAARARFPLPDHQLQALFDHVNKYVEIEGCDHSHRFTEQWLSNNGITTEPVLSWLEQNGGYCDCEVIMNAEDSWENCRDTLLEPNA